MEHLPHPRTARRALVPDDDDVTGNDRVRGDRGEALLLRVEDARRPAMLQSLVAEWQGTQKQVRASLDSIGRVLAAAGAQYAETEAQTLRMFS